LTDFNRVSQILERQLPEFVRADHPTFVAFLEAYYEFLEQSGQSGYVGRQLMSSIDIDDALPDFLEYFYKDFLPLIPENILADRTLLLKHAQTFYKARGTEKSFKLLFRILYNENVEIRYPKNNILIASGGKWFQEKSLRIVPSDIDTFSLFTNLRIFGITSNASATVERVEIFQFLGTTSYQIFVTDILGTFQASETIYGVYTDNVGNTTRLEGVIDGGINEILIVVPGTGYSPGDAVRISGGGGTGALGEVTDTSTGEIKDWVINRPGTGYILADRLLITPQIGDPGTGAAGIISVIDETHAGRQHAQYYSLNTDIIGIYANVAYNAATFTANLTGTVNIAANSNVMVGTTGLGVANTIFATQLGANVIISINGNSAIVFGVANNTHALINNAVSPIAVTNANIVVTMAMQTSNVNTPFYSALTFNLLYGPCGPIYKIATTAVGQNYAVAPSATVDSNQYTLFSGFGYLPSNMLAYIQGAGIIGSVQINNGGTGYVIGEEINFTTAHGSTGRNAGAYVGNVAANGAITEIVLAYPRIAGRAKTNSTSVVVTGINSTTFTTSLVANDHIVIGNEERRVVSIANNASLNVNSAFTVNTANSRISKRLDFVGGIGYDNVRPPTITVSSIAGSNANLTLGNILGFGANLSSTSDAGAIRAVRIINPGVGYTSNANADMTLLGDGNAVLLPTIVPGVFTYPGYYLDSTSFLSSSSKLEDRDYYQPYSYVLRSRATLEEYGQIVKSILHPAGTIGFGETALDTVINSNVVSSFTITTANT